MTAGTGWAERWERWRRSLLSPHCGDITRSLFIDIRNSWGVSPGLNCFCCVSVCVPFLHTHVNMHVPESVFVCASRASLNSAWVCTWTKRKYFYCTSNKCSASSDDINDKVTPARELWAENEGRKFSHKLDHCPSVGWETDSMTERENISCQWHACIIKCIIKKYIFTFTVLLYNWNYTEIKKKKTDVKGDRIVKNYWDLLVWGCFY